MAIWRPSAELHSHIDSKMFVSQETWTVNVQSLHSVTDPWPSQTIFQVNLMLASRALSGDLNNECAEPILVSPINGQFTTIFWVKLSIEELCVPGDLNNVYELSSPVSADWPAFLRPHSKYNCTNVKSYVPVDLNSNHAESPLLGPPPCGHSWYHCTCILHISLTKYDFYIPNVSNTVNIITL